MVLPLRLRWIQLLRFLLSPFSLNLLKEEWTDFQAFLSGFCSLKFSKRLRGQNFWLEPKRIGNTQDVVELTRESHLLAKYNCLFIDLFFYVLSGGLPPNNIIVV